jgi:hypothetical protein
VDAIRKEQVRLSLRRDKVGKKFKRGQVRGNFVRQFLIQQ